MKADGTFLFPLVSRRALSALVFILCLAQAGAVGGASRTEDSAAKYFGASPGVLAGVKARLAAGDPSLEPALKHLVEEAEAALRVEPPSVLNKTSTPPSGDKHDYSSTAPYFWPNPASSNGLPYVRHDGRVNPQSRGPASDRRGLGQMAETVHTLALAYYFTGKEHYAAHAARCLRTWFLDPATRMNPNLEFAQAVPGANTGRGTGIIESRTIAEAADAAQLLAGSAAWTPADQRALGAWLGKFLDWLRASRNGKQEAAARNNHGTWYDVQVARLALVLGKTELARQVVEDAKRKRVCVQVQPDGRQPLELERTAAFGYSRFNLQALFALATLGEHARVDLWHYESADGRSLRKALDFLLPYADVPPKKWPYPQIRGIDPADFATLLRLAARAYHDPRYEAILDKLPAVSQHRLQLLSPSPAPVRTQGKTAGA